MSLPRLFHRRRALGVLVGLLALGSGHPSTAAAVPMQQSPPTLSGVVAVGSAVTCNPGQWAGNGPLTKSYRWVIDGRGPDPYVGTGLTYEPVPADQGWPLQCEETVTDADDTSAQNTQAQLVAAPQPFANVKAPTLSGGFRSAQTVNCLPGTWTRSASFAYAWLRGDAVIAGANAASYVLTDADAGSTVYCRVTATATVGGQTATAVSGPVFVGAAELPPPTTPPPPPAVDPNAPVRLVTGLPDFPPFERAALEDYLNSPVAAKVVPGALSWKSPAFTVLPPGDVRVNGIEITQATQYRLTAFAGGGLPNRCTNDPIPWTAAICPPGEPVKYAGVKLVAGRPATARVFLDREGVKRSTPIQARLTVRTSAGAVIGSMVQAASLKTSVPQGTPRLVTDDQRRDAAASVNFTIPGSYLREGGTTLEAEVVPQEEACASGTCTPNNRFVLVGVPAVETGVLRVGTVQVEFDPQPPTANRITAIAGSTASFDRELVGGARSVLPLRAVEVREQAAAVTANTRVCDFVFSDPGPLGIAARTDRSFLPSCRGLRGKAEVDRVAAQTPGWLGGIRRYDTLVGLAQAKDFYARGWGTTNPSLRAVPVGALSGPTAITEVSRPLRTVAHELAHNAGLQHAGPSCAGSGGEEWLPDNEGRLQGVGWNAGQIPYDYPGVQGTPVFYDFMSYCGSAGEGDVWVSPKNWDRMVDTFAALKDRAAVSGVLLGRRAQAATLPSGDHLFVTALAGGGAAKVDRVTIGPARVVTGTPSAFAVRALDAAGAVLGEAEALAIPANEGAAGPVEMIQAQLPPAAAAAAKVQIIVKDGGAVAGAADRPAQLAPVRKIRALKDVGGDGTLAVVWRAAKEATTADVLVSSDAGKTWKTAWSGPAAKGRVLLGGAQVPRAPKTKIRVRTSDGWNSASGDSPTFAADGAPPQLTLVQPLGRATIEQGEALALQATAADDSGRTLAKGKIQWLDAGRRIATGESAAATGLTPGKHALEVVAQDRFGRTSSRKFKVRVRAAAPTFTALVVPPTVAAGAGSVKLSVASSRASELRLLGQRFNVGTRPRSITVRLPKAGAGELPLKLELRSGGRTSRVSAALTRG